MSLRVATLALAAAALAGCASLRDEPTPPSRDFPIGIFSVSDPSHLDSIRDAGFDVIFPSGANTEAVAAKASRLGLRLLLSPGGRRGSPPPRGPVLGWYATDEPDVNRMSPGRLAALDAEIRAWDPRRTVVFTIGQGSAAREFGTTADVVMLDWYPVPHLPLDSVADQLDEAARLLPRGKPVWMILQAFDWREEPQRDPKKPRIGRFPTHSEIRFMSYLSVLHGARGLFYFRFTTPGGRPLVDEPENWQAVARVAREMRSLKPMLAGGRLIKLPFPPNPDGPESRCWGHTGRDTCVLINRRKDVMLRFPEEINNQRWRPLFENRREIRELLQPVGRGWYLRPHQVLVLERTPGPPSRQ